MISFLIALHWYVLGFMAELPLCFIFLLDLFLIIGNIQRLENLLCLIHTYPTLKTSPAALFFSVSGILFGLKLIRLFNMLLLFNFLLLDCMFSMEIFKLGFSSTVFGL